MARLFRVYAEADGWYTVRDLPGWDSYNVRVQAAVVNGQPRVTALLVEPLQPGEPQGLVGARLKALPLRELAVVVLRAVPDGPRVGDLKAAMRRIAKTQPPKHHPRAATTVEQVAEVWQLAYDAGQPPRAAVVEQLHMSARTADRYIARAREDGLISKRGERR